MLALGLDAFLIALLLVALVLFWRLEQRLNALRNGQDGMRDAARELIEATHKAELATRNLRAASEEAGRDSRSRISEPRAVARTPESAAPAPRARHY